MSTQRAETESKNPIYNDEGRIYPREQTTTQQSRRSLSSSQRSHSLYSTTQPQQEQQISYHRSTTSPPSRIGQPFESSSSDRHYPRGMNDEELDEEEDRGHQDNTTTNGYDEDRGGGGHGGHGGGRGNGARSSIFPESYEQNEAGHVFVNADAFVGDTIGVDVVQDPIYNYDDCNEIANTVERSMRKTDYILTQRQTNPDMDEESQLRSHCRSGNAKVKLATPIPLKNHSVLCDKSITAFKHAIIAHICVELSDHHPIYNNQNPVQLREELMRRISQSIDIVELAQIAASVGFNYHDFVCFNDKQTNVRNYVIDRCQQKGVTTVARNTQTKEAIIGLANENGIDCTPFIKGPDEHGNRGRKHPDRKKPTQAPRRLLQNILQVTPDELTQKDAQEIKQDIDEKKKQLYEITREFRDVHRQQQFQEWEQNQNQPKIGESYQDYLDNNKRDLMERMETSVQMILSQDT